MKTKTDSGKMRITSAPNGQAPLEIREKWIGVEIPFIEVGVPTGTVRGTMNLKEVAKQEVFVVDQVEALTALHRKAPDAAEWWKEMGYPIPGAQFTFNRDCAEIIN